MFCHSASAVPWYHSGPRRCCAGMISMNSPNSPRRKPQPLPMCWISECALYCVSTEICRMPEFRQFDSTKSMMRNLPPNGAAGLQRSSVSCLSRSPRPPAMITASVPRVRRLRYRRGAPTRCCSVDIRRLSGKYRLSQDVTESKRRWIVAAVHQYTASNYSVDFILVFDAYYASLTKETDRHAAGRRRNHAPYARGRDAGRSAGPQVPAGTERRPDLAGAAVRARRCGHGPLRLRDRAQAQHRTKCRRPPSSRAPCIRCCAT